MGNNRAMKRDNGECPTGSWRALDATLEDECDAEDHPVAPFCPKYHRAIELVGRRWTGAILRVLLSGRTRFTDVTGAVPGLSDRLLSERLKELEGEGIVTRLVFPETPVRIEYRLTDKGRALHDVIDAVSRWAEEWAVVPTDRSAGGECQAMEATEMGLLSRPR